MVITAADATESWEIEGKVSVCQDLVNTPHGHSSSQSGKCHMVEHLTSVMESTKLMCSPQVNKIMMLVEWTVWAPSGRHPQGK